MNKIINYYLDQKFKPVIFGITLQQIIQLFLKLLTAALVILIVVGIKFSYDTVSNDYDKCLAVKPEWECRTMFYSR